MKIFKHLFSLIALYICLISPAFGDRLKDLTSLAGVRSNQLVGYGVVVGLAGTGDGNEATEQVDVTVRFLANLFPDLSIFNLTEQVVYERAISSDYMLHGSLTAFTYIALGLLLAAVLFSRRDFV